MQNFKKLIVWQKSHQLTLEIYKRTQNFPKSELFGLTSQIRRCSVSIEGNIAEGSGRRTDKDTSRFFQIAFGSLQETDCYLIIAKDLNYLALEDYQTLNNLVTEIRAMLSTLIKKHHSQNSIT